MKIKKATQKKKSTEPIEINWRKQDLNLQQLAYETNVLPIKLFRKYAMKKKILQILLAISISKLNISQYVHY